MENKFKLGAIDSPADLRDYDYSMIAHASNDDVKILDSLVLDYPYKILNQGEVGSCVAHALSRLKSYIDGRNSENVYSVGFVYGYRQEDDWQGTGMVTREALKNLVKVGDCKYSSFPVNEEYPAIKNTLNKYGLDKLVKEAANNKALAYIRLQTDELKEYFCKFKKPVAISVNVYDNFYEANSNKGEIPSIPKGKKKGSHLMLCIGYIGNKTVCINSWGDHNGDKGRYYLDINSEIIKEIWALEDKKNVMEPEKKKYTVGWNKDNKGWWYSSDGITYFSSCWQQIKGVWYYFDSNGYALDGKWFKDKNKWYFLDKDTCAMHRGWLKDKGKWYYLDLKNGEMLTGWFQDTNGKWYYLDIEDGFMYADCKILINGKYYSFDKSGALI